MADDISQKVREFFEHYPQRTFDKGELLIRGGEAPAGVFYLAEGRVIQYDISPSGSDVVVNIFRPRTFLPMSWAINRTPNRYFFEAATKVVARLAPADKAMAFLHDEPEVAFDLLQRVYRGTDGLLRRMAHLMGGDANTRLMFELLNAAYRFGKPGMDGSVIVPVTESDLAKSSGLARETISRGLQKLKVAQLIEVTHAGFILTDIAQLEALLGDRV